MITIWLPSYVWIICSVIRMQTYLHSAIQTFKFIFLYSVVLIFIVAEHLLVYPPEHVIFGEYAYTIWDDAMIKHILELMNPQNMRVDIVTKSFKKTQGEVLCWSTQYIMYGCMYVCTYINIHTFWQRFKFVCFFLDYFQFFSWWHQVWCCYLHV